MHRSTRKYLIGLLTALTFAVGAADVLAANRVVLGNTAETALTTSTDPHTAKTLKALREQVKDKGAARIIVGVRTAFAPEGKMNAAKAEQQRKEIADKQSALLKKIPSLKNKSEKVKQFTTIPFMALEVDATELEALADDADITSIEEDRIVKPTLAESVPLIGGTNAWNSGYTGAGQTVAILDTGVDSTHPFLTSVVSGVSVSKVVAEACYSTNYPPSQISSVCPDGVTQSTAAGSAMPYGGGCPAGGCDHGTHVAGIAAGNGSYANVNFSGVAKDASVIAVQVFSNFYGFFVSAFTSDIIRGLERVYALRNDYSIAAVNMSLGGGGYSDQASCDADNLSTKSAIDNLRSVNIATVIASGNNGYTS